MPGSNHGIGSLFCNDDDNPFQNTHILENNDSDVSTQDETPVEQNQIEIKKSKKEIAKDEKLIHSKTVKFTETENNYLQDLKDVLNTDKDTKAIRYCVDLIIEYHGDEINALAKKKRKAGTINTFK